MSDPRLERLEELFHRAVDLAADDRRRLLEPLEDSDPALCAEVLRLLVRADSGRDLSAVGALVSPLGRALQPASAVGSDPPHFRRDFETAALAGATIEARVGPYRLLERIGQGGMGEVFRAERADGEYRMTVAVKVIRAGFLRSEPLARFRSERQILARLEHPGIARLLDGGVAADGRPYLVMEYAEGRPITHHCDAERLTVEERLALFLTVCRAVQHAHRNLVVHRDLKPSNILVTAESEVKLLDFGIAKLLAPDRDYGPTLTRTLVPVMTPAYASPEQVRGETITTATDAYALGLLLYELLCGRPAQSPEDGSLAAIERAICEEEQPRPSDAVALGHADEVEARLAARGGLRLERLRRRLRGDLDTIVVTALRKDPGRRYASAEQLAGDVERHLAGLPVLARPDTLRYRTAKFLRRHRLAVGAAAAAALSVAVGLLLALVGLAQAQRAERRALDEAATSTQISEFLVDLFRANDPAESKGDAVTAREILDRGVERIGERLADQPMVRARLLRSMARAYETLGLFDPALELAQQQLALETEHLGEESAEVGRTLVELADLHGEQGDYARSRDLARQGLGILERLPAPDDKTLSDALAELGRAQAQLGELDQAEVTLERAVAVLERSRGPDHRDLWSPLNNLAILSWLRGDIATARGRYERALAIAERELGAEHPSVAHLLNNLALVHRQAGELDQSIAAHQRALAIRESALAPDHVDIAESLNNLGDALRDQGELARAKEMLERALTVRERALGPEPPYVATTWCNLGLTHLGLGDLETARPLLERSAMLLERAVGPDHVMISYPVLGLARIAQARGNHEAAQRGFERAIALRESGLGPDHPDLAAALVEYAAFLRSRGRTAEADALERWPPGAQGVRPAS